MKRNVIDAIYGNVTECVGRVINVIIYDNFMVILFDLHELTKVKKV